VLPLEGVTALTILPVLDVVLGIQEDLLLATTAPAVLPGIPFPGFKQHLAHKARG
jgi:hypothetical protein